MRNVNLTIVNKEPQMTDNELDHFITVQDSFNRFPAFVKLYMEGIISRKQYIDNLIDAYTMSDNLYKYRDLVRTAFEWYKSLIDESGSKIIDGDIISLPQYIKVYRGMTKAESRNKQYGVSWTLDKNVAEFFAYNYMRNYDTAKYKKTVISKTINKDDILYYSNNRNEKEIIILI